LRPLAWDQKVLLMDSLERIAEALEKIEKHLASLTKQATDIKTITSMKDVREATQGNDNLEWQAEEYGR
jgi:hypothetical protein